MDTDSLTLSLDEVRIHILDSEVRVTEIGDGIPDFNVHEFLFLEAKMVLLARVRQFRERILDDTCSIGVEHQVNGWTAASQYIPFEEETNSWAMALSAITEGEISRHYFRLNGSDLNAIALSMFLRDSAILIEVILRNSDATFDQAAFELQSLIHIDFGESKNTPS